MIHGLQSRNSTAGIQSAGFVTRVAEYLKWQIELGSLVDSSFGHFAETEATEGTRRKRENFRI